MTTFTNYKPNWAIHPGEDIKEFTEYRGWSSCELAKKTELSLDVINAIIQAKPRKDSKDRITLKVADRLAKVFKMKKSFFIRSQLQYDEIVKKQTK